MGLASILGMQPTARIYKVGLMLAALATIAVTLYMASSVLLDDSTRSSLSSNLPNMLGGGNKAAIPIVASVGSNLNIGNIPAARISYDEPAGGDRVNGAIVVLVRNSELEGLRKSMRMFEDRFNRRFKYPYVLLNDQNFTQEFRDGIAAITKNEVRFGILDSDQWGYSQSVTPEETARKLEYNKNRYLYGGSLSYRFMCRFQSGKFYHHPLVRDLDWYWRLEPDVEYYCDIDYDPFVFMRDRGIKYGFTIAPREGRRTVESLWYHTREWIKKNTHLLPDRSLVNWIVDLSLYRSEAYESYFNYLDESQGFFYERWGDAPVHSIAATLLLQKGEIHWFEDIGYKHPGNMHCPRDPAMHAKCVCDPGKSYTYRSACQTRFAKVNNMAKERMLEIMRNSESSYLSPPVPEDSKSNQK
ncbi:alpha-1,2-mannosyltransferase ktr1 [Coemansia asiatica]|uniref:Alpha-1,2-mannosyltransferase ktr1 n=1 Tax=Coemansia asiatica TaxID=1052880 RepID=A0A9W8CHF6_9FUNG|nr:alpha-1,2-mannosyltransferase ktr1 [Coemansia asiatica]